MPEHVQLLIGEPEKGTPSTVMQVLKQRFANSVLRARWRRSPSQGPLWEQESEHIWQARFYDFNVWSQRKRVEKLRYMHDNPVKRGLVLEPEQWAWSSFRDYAYGEPGTCKTKPMAGSETQTDCLTRSPELPRPCKKRKSRAPSCVVAD